jgi:hypothetical protein
MQDTVELLRSRMRDVSVDLAEGEIFELLAAGCFLCCRDGARGGNKNCAPDVELLDES